MKRTLNMSGRGIYGQRAKDSIMTAKAVHVYTPTVAGSLSRLFRFFGKEIYRALNLITLLLLPAMAAVSWSTLVEGKTVVFDDEPTKWTVRQSPFFVEGGNDSAEAAFAHIMETYKHRIVDSRKDARFIAKVLVHVDRPKTCTEESTVRVTIRVTDTYLHKQFIIYSTPGKGILTCTKGAYESELDAFLNYHVLRDRDRLHARFVPDEDGLL